MASGQDVLIPPVLSQSSLPMSFRYYDPIIAFVQEGSDNLTRIKTLQRISTAAEKFNDENLMVIMMKKLMGDGKERFQVKVNSLAKLSLMEVNYNNSEHCTAL